MARKGREVAGAAAGSEAAFCIAVGGLDRVLAWGSLILGNGEPASPLQKMGFSAFLTRRPAVGARSPAISCSWAATARIAGERRAATSGGLGAA
jgi:hypothetical protein